MKGVDVLKAGTYREQRQALWEMHDVMRRAWTSPRHGRDIATKVGDILRDSGGLEMLVNKVEDATAEMRLDSAKGLQKNILSIKRKLWGTAK